MKEKKPKIKKPTLTERNKDLARYNDILEKQNKKLQEDIASIGCAVNGSFNNCYGEKMPNTAHEIIFLIGKLKASENFAISSWSIHQIEERIQKLEEATQTKIGG